MMDVNRRGTSNQAILSANHELNEREMAEGKTALDSYPERLSLYWKSVCSMDCIMCAKHAFGYPLDSEDDLLRVLEKVDGLMPCVAGFCLCPSGEPLESRMLFRLAGHAYADTRILIVTSGQLLRGAILDQVFEYRINHLSVSLNAATPKTYEDITGRSFEVLLGNLRELLARRDVSDGRPHMDYSIVAMKRTEAELADFVRLSADLGGERAIIRKLGRDIPAAACQRSIRFDPASEDILCHDGRDEGLLDTLREVGREVGIRVSADFGDCFTRPPYTYGFQVARKVDPRPWKALEFLPSGESRFACGKPADLGNIWDYDTFHEYWNSPQWLAARQRTLDAPHEPAV